MVLGLEEINEAPVVGKFLDRLLKAGDVAACECHKTHEPFSLTSFLSRWERGPLTPRPGEGARVAGRNARFSAHCSVAAGGIAGFRPSSPHGGWPHSTFLGLSGCDGCAVTCTLSQEWALRSAVTAVLGQKQG